MEDFGRFAVCGPSSVHDIIRFGGVKLRGGVEALVPKHHAEASVVLSMTGRTLADCLTWRSSGKNDVIVCCNNTTSPAEEMKDVK
jgi:hypothetical protein